MKYKKVSKKYPLLLGQAYVHVHNLIITHRDKLKDEELERLRELKYQLKHQKRWSPKLWSNFKYVTRKY